MVDTHCHLDSCDPPDAELVARAREAGVRRLATVGMDGPSIERALAAAREHEEVFAIVGRHPHETEGFGAADLEEIEQAAADPQVRAIGETGLDYYRDYAPRDDQRRAFEAQLELAARLGLPVVDPHPRGRGRHLRDPAPSSAGGLPAVILHCFSAPDRLDECVERGYLCSFAGNVTYPKADGPPGAPRGSCPADRCSWRPTRPTCAPARARQAQRARQRGAHGPARRRAARRRLRGARAHGRGQRRARASDGERRSRARRACAACAASRSGPTASWARTS